MVQTENTAIVLRHVNYRDNDRMVTLFSPSRGRIDAVIRNCRKPKSHNLNAGELFALGDYMLYESGGRATVTSVHLIETFYALRQDYERLTCGTYLLSLTEAVIEPEQERQELFMLLLHTLSRLAFSDQPWRPLLAGFLLHFAACEGFKPRLNHCVLCGKKLEEAEPCAFDQEEGGLCCAACRRRKSGSWAPGEAGEDRFRSPPGRCAGCGKSCRADRPDGSIRRRARRPSRCCGGMWKAGWAGGSAAGPCFRRNKNRPRGG